MKIQIRRAALADCMNQKGYDIYKLADQMGVQPSTIYRILNGSRGIGAQTIVKLLLVFDMTESDFDRLFIFK